MFIVPTFEEILHNILRDTQSLNPAADVNVDSDHYVHAARLAACAVNQYAHQSWQFRQIFPDTADSEYLERHAGIHGIRRRAGTYATGDATITGEIGTVLPSNLAIQCGSLRYYTTESAAIGEQGKVVVKISAEREGDFYNIRSTPAVLLSPPNGVSSNCVAFAYGGVDAENDEQLLSRLLDKLRYPAAGGNARDYRTWALSIDGVFDAFVFPLRRGLGTVDVAIIAEQGLPSAEVVAKVQDYIEDVRPVTAKNVRVFVPDIQDVNIHVAVKLHGISKEEAEKRISTALAHYFSAVAPAQDVVISQIEAAISNVKGVVDRRLITPVSNQIAQTESRLDWFRLGTVEVSLL